jgi:hypothetical protein
MPEIILCHLPESDRLAQSAEPDVVELVRIDVLHDVGHVQGGILPPLHQIGPVLIVVVLDGDPAVVVPEIRVIGKHQRAGLVLEMHDPVDVVGRRVCHVPHDLPDVPLLSVGPPGHNLLRKRSQPRFPRAEQRAHFLVVL